MARSGRTVHDCNQCRDYSSHVTWKGRDLGRGQRVDQALRRTPPLSCYGANPVRSRKCRQSATQFAPLSLVIWIENRIKEVALNSPNKALAALVEHAETSAGNKRRIDRSKAVLPVRISGHDGAGTAYSELVHTLDVSRSGVRLGGVRRCLEVGSQVVLQYRQHKTEFRVVWTKPVGSGAEQQVGLEAGGQKDLWGLDTNATNRPQAAPVAESGRASMGA